MRILLIHATSFNYRVVEEAISNPPDPPSTGEFENCLVAFVTVEFDDGVLEVSRASYDIVAHASRLGVNCIILYPYAHLSPDLASPEVAYRVLRSLEDSIRSSWSGVIHRAPFGWYKAFNLSCPGHPLSELSRSIRGEHVIRYKGLPLEEAIAKGLVENWLIQRDPWSGDTLDLVERLGLNTVRGRVTFWELEQILAEEFRVISRVNVGKPRHIYGLQGITSLVRVCSNSPNVNTLISWGDIGESLLVVDRDPLELLKKLNVRIQDLHKVTLDVGELDVGVNGYSLVYKARKGGAVPLVYALGDRYCLGPITSLLYAILDSGLKDADEGKTPVLHYKLAPIQVALIPVSESHLDYVRMVDLKLRELGVRASILKDGGLGSRVRDAGRRWIPLIVVAGDREVETKTLTIRRRWEPGRQEVVTVDEFLEEIRRLNTSNPLH